MFESCGAPMKYVKMTHLTATLGESMERANLTPDAILFDWDNTIVDSWRTSYQAVNNTFAHFGKDPMTESEFLMVPQTSLKDNLPLLFGDDATEAEHFYYHFYGQIHLKELTILPGVLSLIQTIDAAGIPMAIVSNKTGKMLRTEVDFLNWNRYFEIVVGSRDLEHDKPSPVPALFALDACGVEPSKKVFFVGDSAVDVACARASGLTPVLIGGLNQTIRNAEDVLRFENCGEFRQFLPLGAFAASF